MRTIIRFLHIQYEHRSTYEEVIAHLKDKGSRITETRKAVIAYLIQTKDHPSTEMMYKDLRRLFLNMSLATIYNNLKALVDEGFITEIKRNNDTTTSYDFMGHDHLNVICDYCGKITDINITLPSFKKEAQEKTGYLITRKLVTIYGVCPNCI